MWSNSRHINSLVGTLATVLTLVPAQALAQDALARARALYNEGRFEAAIEAARGARGARAGSVDLIVARANLEMFRAEENAERLSTARSILAHLGVDGLSPRERSDALFGQAEALYLGGQYGAAAELFAIASGSALAPTLGSRERVLEWWAISTDRYARTLPAPARTEAYDRLAEAMSEELDREPSSRVALYWLPAALRSARRLDRAWSAAVAAWVAAGLSPDARNGLRTDLDRLVIDGIIPDRVRQVAERERADLALKLNAEWDGLKESWKAQGTSP
jgi:hypothetical protein